MPRKAVDSIALASILVLVTAIWWNHFLPLQDYPEWLFQSSLIKTAIGNSQQTIATYEIRWFPLPPNSLVSIVLAVLQFFVSVNVAGKLLLTVYVLLFIFGWLYFFSRRHGHHPLRWLGIVFVFNYFFFMGYVSYILGLSILFYAMGWFNHVEQFSWWIVLGVIMFSLLLYTAHGIPCFIFYLVIAGRLILRNNRFHTLGQNLAIGFALLPSIVLLAIYIAYNNTPTQWVLYPSPILQLTNWVYAISFFNRLIPFEQTLPISLLNILITAFLAGVAYSFRKRLFHSTALRMYGPLALAMLFCIIANPVTRIGELFGIGQRFVLPAIFFFFASFSVVNADRKIENAIVILGLIMSVLYFAQMLQFDKDAESVYEAIKPSYEKARTPLVIARGYVEEFDKRMPQRFSAGIRTMIHFRRVLDIESVPRNFVTFGSALLQVQKNKMDPQIVGLDSCVDKYQYASEAIRALTVRKSELCQQRDYVFVIGNENVIRQYSSWLSSCYRRESLGNTWLILTKKDCVPAM